LFAFKIYRIAGDEWSMNKLANHIEVLVPESQDETYIKWVNSMLFNFWCFGSI